MIDYVLIGLGGALGSLARAWAATAMARLTGPAFPWGTILINIAGSFLIGLIAGLTAADGRAPGMVATRAFLMVGFCGGFTTFSSFSLQTLDLIRDGRAGQAMGNVALSVIVCLGAVALGHRAGVAAHAQRREASAAQDVPGHILAVIDRPDRAGAVLDAAERWRAALATRTGGAAPGLRALLVRAAPGAPLLPSEDVLTAETAAEQDAVAGATRLRAAVAGWHGGGFETTEIAEHPAAAIAASGAAGIVLARPGPHDPPWIAEALHAALFRSGAPVLVLPPSGAARPFGAHVALGWRAEDGCAASALDAALPLLAPGGRFTVLHVGAALPLPAALSGRSADSLGVARTDGPAGAALLAAATAQGADLLAMGAFTHASPWHDPWREALLGGMTRHVLTHATIPLLLRH